MNLQLLTNGTPDEKKWLDIVCYDIKCNSIVPNVPFVTVSDKIESNDLSSSITCNDIGIGGGGMSAIGNIDMNLNLLRNVSAIDTTDATLNITTPTTQIENGSSELNINIDSLPRITQNAIKTKLECGVSSLQLAAVSDGLSADTVTYIGASNIGNTQNTISLYLPDEYLVIQNNAAIQRIVVDNNKSAIYSKNATSGPAGSLLELNNDSTFTLGCYFANNGIIECRPNSLALYGNAATSAITITGSDIITSLGLAGRIDREILNTVSQTFKDAGGIERLRVDNSGVSINNSYTLPSSDGLANQYIFTNGAGTCSWSSPQIVGLYSATGSPVIVANTTVASSIIPTGVGNLSVPANYFTPGMSFLLKCGGTFRDSSNGQQFTMRLTNSGTLFSTGLLTLNSVPLATTGWNVECQFTFTGGTQLITNFTFSYNNNSDARGFTNQQVNNTFNPTVINTLGFTMQWNTANINNTLTCNYFTLTKLF